MTLKKSSSGTSRSSSWFKASALNLLALMAITIVLTLFTYLFFFSNPASKNATNTQSVRIQTTTDEITVNVEIADTPELRQKGLMQRTELAEDSGMLFVFETDQILSFWMKNTLIPLDIIFIKADGEIDTIHKNTETDQTKETYSSKSLIKFALEVNSGFCDKFGVKLGDKVIFPENVGI